MPAIILLIFLLVFSFSCLIFWPTVYVWSSLLKNQTHQTTESFFPEGSTAERKAFNERSQYELTSELFILFPSYLAKLSFVTAT